LKAFSAKTFIRSLERRLNLAELALEPHRQAIRDTVQPLVDQRLTELPPMLSLHILRDELYNELSRVQSVQALKMGSFLRSLERSLGLDEGSLDEHKPAITTAIRPWIMPEKLALRFPFRWVGDWIAYWPNGSKINFSLDENGSFKHLGAPCQLHASADNNAEFQWEDGTKQKVIEFRGKAVKWTTSPEERVIYWTRDLQTEGGRSMREETAAWRGEWIVTWPNGSKSSMAVDERGFFEHVGTKCQLQVADSQVTFQWPDGTKTTSAQNVSFFEHVGTKQIAVDVGRDSVTWTTEPQARRIVWTRDLEKDAKLQEEAEARAAAELQEAAARAVAEAQAAAVNKAKEAKDAQDELERRIAEERKGKEDAEKKAMEEREAAKTPEQRAAEQREAEEKEKASLERETRRRALEVAKADRDREAVRREQRKRKDMKRKLFDQASVATHKIAVRATIDGHKGPQRAWTKYVDASTTLKSLVLAWAHSVLQLKLSKIPKEAKVHPHMSSWDTPVGDLRRKLVVQNGCLIVDLQWPKIEEPKVVSPPKKAAVAEKNEADSESQRPGSLKRKVDVEEAAGTLAKTARIEPVEEAAPAAPAAHSDAPQGMDVDPANAELPDATTATGAQQVAVQHCLTDPANAELSDATPATGAQQAPPKVKKSIKKEKKASSGNRLLNKFMSESENEGGSDSDDSNIENEASNQPASIPQDVVPNGKQDVSVPASAVAEKRRNAADDAEFGSFSDNITAGKDVPNSPIRVLPTPVRA